MWSEVFSLGFLVSLLAGTIRLATPILMPALGQIYTQRAGILNLGVEGTMLMAAVCGFSVTAATGSLWFGFAVGVLTGALYSVLMAWLSVSLRVNQVIAGIGMNILATGLAAYIYRLIFGIRTLPAKIVPFQSLDFFGPRSPMWERCCLTTTFWYISPLLWCRSPGSFWKRPPSA